MDFNVTDLLPLLQVYALKFLGAVAVLVIGFIVASFIVRGVDQIMVKREVDSSLRSFFRSLLGIGLKAMVVLSALSVAGVEVTSFIAILGAAGLAIGLALQGSLSNFAGGVMILLFRPFKVGDYIETQGHAGTVKEITLFHSVLTPLDNRTVIIPNGALYNNPIVNFSTQLLRRLVLTYGIAYGDDADKAKAVLLEMLKNDERVLDKPNEPMVAIASLGDSSVNFTVRCWVQGADFWPLTFDLNDRVYKTFAQQGLNIPFPQMDVHVHQN
jgi:small conductance mechanosensitive channel